MPEHTELKLNSTLMNSNQKYENLFWGKAFYNAFENTFKLLAGKNYSVIKGEPLSFQAYGMQGCRRYNDLDILIPKTELNNLIGKFDVDRYKIVFGLLCSHQIPKITMSNEPVIISLDLNFDIFWGEYEGKRVDIGEFLSDTIEMEIYGVKVKTLPPLKAMVQLILHHYKDMNSIFLLATRKSIKHEMFKDVYYLLKNNLEAISLDKLYNISAEYEIIPYVFYVLYYTGQIFDDDVLREYIEAFRTPEGERLLNLYGLCEKERKEWKCDFKTRLESENLFDLIKDDLTERDKEKIAINRRVFLGESE